MSRYVLTTEESLRLDFVSSFRLFAPAEPAAIPNRGDRSDYYYYSGGYNLSSFAVVAAAATM